MPNEYIQDAGHGEKDPGASFNGHIEKVYTLEAAAYVNRRLNELGIKSTMTRTSDVYLDSVPRTNIVKQSKAKVCLSHHFNAGGGDGVETIHSILSNGKLASLIAKAISAADVKFRRVFSRQGTSGDFYYMHRLTGSVETVIVEYEFLDGPNNAKLKDKAFREGLYEGTVKAVCEYEGVQYKAPGTQSKPTPPKQGGSIVPNLFDPQSQEMQGATTRVLQRLEKQKDNPLSDVHRKNLEAGTLTDSQAIGLIFVALDRGHVDLK